MSRKSSLPYEFFCATIAAEGRIDVRNRRKNPENILLLIGYGIVGLCLAAFIVLVLTVGFYETPETNHKETEEYGITFKMAEEP